jgi:hypothetical protein
MKDSVKMRAMGRLPSEEDVTRNVLNKHGVDKDEIKKKEAYDNRMARIKTMAR